MLSALCVLTRLILATTLRGECYSHPHLTDEETDLGSLAPEPTLFVACSLPLFIPTVQFTALGAEQVPRKRLLG